MSASEAARVEDSVELAPQILGRGTPSTKSAVLYGILGALSFHLAWLVPVLGGLMLCYAWFLIRISDHPSARVGFRLGFLNGILVFAPHLAWFWNIFGMAAICLWAVLAFFTGAFVFLAHFTRATFARGSNDRSVEKKFLTVCQNYLPLALIPTLWTGLEYFRGEVYFLKFSWLSVGYAFFEKSGLLPIGTLGVYGIGFVIFLCAALISLFSWKMQKRIVPAVVLLLIALANFFERASISAPAPGTLNIAGIQLEFPASLEIPKYLDRVIAEHPAAQLLVLSEYTFDSGVPQQVREWCRKNRRYLIAGGKDDSVPGNFYNTAFVIGPNGEILFQQPKSVPIQFFKDGLPAASQEVWDSPWGKIAIPVCYDLSYRHVMDRFIAKGAQAIIVPFMDVTDWGAWQHRLHARIAPLRAREYGIPIFRLGSSGISQIVDARGNVRAALPYPGQERILSGTINLTAGPSIPLDHWMGPVCAVVTALFGVWTLVRSA